MIFMDPLIKVETFNGAPASVNFLAAKLHQVSTQEIIFNKIYLTFARETSSQ